MYDKALEDLIDIIIADGVITDKEYNVVINKARSLGIPEDEIVVYIEGKLSQMKGQTPPPVQSNPKVKIGKIRICPSCGARLESFAGRCSDCGHELTDVESSSKIQALLWKLDEIESTNRTRTSSFRKEKREKTVKDFLIPNSKEDIIELIMLCRTNIIGEDSANDAWIAKGEEAITKGELLFPKDPVMGNAINELRKTLNNKKQKEQKDNKIQNWSFIGAIGLLVILAIFFSLKDDPKKDNNKNDNDIAEYYQEMIDNVNSLSLPNKYNYQRCYREFQNIQWTSKKDTEYYEAFKNVYDTYGFLLFQAFREADVPESEIPADLVIISKSKLDINNDGDIEVPEDLEIKDVENK